MHYGILGGGALGLTLGYRLASQGHRVTLIEREPLVGGLAAGFKVGDAWLDRFYHHLFQTDRDARRLIDELGLGGQLIWPRPKTVTLRGGRAYQLDSPLSLLQFTPLPFVDRVRTGMALAYLKLVMDHRRLQGHHAAAWIRRWMGAKAYDVIWGPLLTGKFGPLAEEIALPWFWARVTCRTASLGYLRGGFQRLYEALGERIVAAGGSLQLGTTVTGIRRTETGVAVTTANGEQTFDRVISTLPTRVTCALTPDLPAAYRQRYEWGRAYGAHCLILSLTQPLTAGYWMNVNDPGFPFMALVEHTNYMPAADYGGRHLVYLGNYRPMDDPLLRRTTAEVVDEFAPHLQKINPAFERSWITEAWSFSAPYAQPIVTTDYPEHIPPFETPMVGLYVANMFQVYPQDRGQSYSIALANRLAAELAAG